jgi:hypothetical protein
VRRRQKFISDISLIPNSQQFPDVHIHNVYIIVKPLEQRDFSLGLPRSSLYCSDANRMTYTRQVSHYIKSQNILIILILRL